MPSEAASCCALRHLFTFERYRRARSGRERDPVAPDPHGHCVRRTSEHLKRIGGSCMRRTLAIDAAVVVTSGLAITAPAVADQNGSKKSASSSSLTKAVTVNGILQHERQFQTIADRNEGTRAFQAIRNRLTTSPRSFARRATPSSDRSSLSRSRASSSQPR